jgi:hypothetical protein
MCTCIELLARLAGGHCLGQGVHWRPATRSWLCNCLAGGQAVWHVTWCAPLADGVWLQVVARSALVGAAALQAPRRG